MKDEAGNKRDGEEKRKEKSHLEWELKGNGGLKQMGKDWF